MTERWDCEGLATRLEVQTFELRDLGDTLAGSGDAEGAALARAAGEHVEAPWRVVEERHRADVERDREREAAIREQLREGETIADFHAAADAAELARRSGQAAG